MALGLSLGILATLESRTIAHAQCNLAAQCPPFGTDNTQTASLTVVHGVPDGENNVIPVQPDDGEIVDVTAIYQLASATHGCGCDFRYAQVSAELSWTGTDWNVACTGCGTGPILAVDACPLLGCLSGGLSHGYELIVDVNINFQFTCATSGAWGTIVQVDFETTEVDDGDTIRTGNCTLMDAVTPTSQTFTASDEGPFECPFTCEDADGPSMVITYE